MKRTILKFGHKLLKGIFKKSGLVVCELMAALKEFSKEVNVAYFPICDAWGSVVIMKP